MQLGTGGGCPDLWLGQLVPRCRHFGSNPVELVLYVPCPFPVTGGRLFLLHLECRQFRSAVALELESCFRIDLLEPGNLDGERLGVAATGIRDAVEQPIELTDFSTSFCMF